MDKITIVLTQQQLDIVLNALNEMPHKVSRITIDEIYSQIRQREEQKSEPKQ